MKNKKTNLSTQRHRGPTKEEEQQKKRKANNCPAVLLFFSAPLCLCVERF
jgi:hypothetical protein